MRYHLEIVDRIATELLEFYPEANTQLVKAMVWMHDYGKALNFDTEFIDKVIKYISILDRKLEIDLNSAPIEVKIVSSADGCSHFVGPFMSLWWWENSDKSIEELLNDNLKKVDKDWNRKIVLAEARRAFEKHYNILLQQSCAFPDKFIVS